jgi:hypothetical protein
LPSQTVAEGDGVRAAAQRITAVRELRSATPVTRLLVLTQLAFNVGFFMVLPYSSVYLARDLGLAASVVGLALGLRTFSQQGLFVVGGLSLTATASSRLC